MKTPDPERHELLHELFESTRANCGPTAEQVCRLVRGEHARRRQRVVIATAAVAAMAAFATIHQRTPSTVTVASIPPAPPATAPASFPIERIDDAGLLEMLKDQPVALASLPNGERRLMMIVQAPGR